MSPQVPIALGRTHLAWLHQTGSPAGPAPEELGAPEDLGGAEGGGGLLPELLTHWGPLLLTFVVVAFVLWLAQRPIKAGNVGYKVKAFYRQLIFVVLLVVSAIALIYASPLKESNRSDLLNFFGIILSGAIALSSTTFLGNIMAGFMLRSLRHFKPGDFLRVDDCFGRVTESGLFHVEIQTEDRDLTTLPNMFLIARPMEVVRSSGTIVSADVSLGYDVNREEVKALLVRAGESIGLEEPFLRIIKLGDYSIEYKLGGLLKDVKGFVSTHTKLRAAMLDALHDAGIEIASPTILSTRRYDAHNQFVPDPAPLGPGEKSDANFDQLAFDKADQAERVESMREQLLELESERERLVEERARAKDGQVKRDIDERLEKLKLEFERVDAQIKGKEARLENE